MDEDFAKAVLAASRRVDVREAVEAVYADLQRVIDARHPVCSASGRCCRFEEYGHRLFVTTIEMAVFVALLPGASGLRQPALPAAPCPFQVQCLCSVHAIRPFGCRIFFCDETSTAWQTAQYETFHARLKRLHEELGVPYFYMEWRAALASASLR